MKRNAWKGFIIIALIGVGLLTAQRFYIRHHLPLMRESVEVATKEGPSEFTTISALLEAKPTSPAETKAITGGRKSMWRDEPVGRSWEQTLEGPGDFLTMSNKLGSALLQRGWQDDIDDTPSSLVREWRKGKWRLSLGQRAFFDHPRRQQVILTLQWGYWHSED